MADAYALWRKALALGGGRELTREQLETLDASPDDPQPGFYRCRLHKDGPYVPVAIWKDGDKLMCLRAGKLLERDLIDDIWTFCIRWPISEKLYREVAAGGAWPDEPPAPIGHNRVSTGDPCEDLRAEFQAEAELAQDFLKKPVTSQEHADRIAVWSKKIAGIVTKANKAFKEEKEPWLEGGRLVDSRWRWRAEADALVKSMKRALDGWLSERERQEREARAEAERKQREAEEAARRAEEQSDPDLVAKAEQARRDAEEAERQAKEAAAAEAGRTGAKVSLHTYYTARITDYEKLLLALKDEPEIREAVTKIANRIARTKGAPMPEGAERVEDRRAA